MAVTPTDPYADIKLWLDVVDKSLKFAAVIVGGLWTAANTQISRVWEHKAETNVTTVLHRKENGHLLIISCQIKNIGQIKFDIKQRGTCAEVFGINFDGTEEKLELFEVFEDHHWIEPGEPVSDPKHLMIKSSYLAIKTTMRIVSTKTEWNASHITTEDEKEEGDE